MTLRPLSPEAWARITELFGELLDLPVDERPGFLADVQAIDPGAAAELASLLEQHDGHEELFPGLPPPGLALSGIQEPPSLRDLSGRVIGAYRLIRLLGSGGMGAVYLAERSDGAFAKQVAVKLLATVLVHARDRFLREREVLAKLEHPNITRLIDGGATEDGWPYLVMEYVEGVPIDRYCHERDLSMDERLELLGQICAGVAHAHKNLVVHCDIKPENILVTADGTVKLLDFGIAKLLDSSAGATLLRPSTPAFSSPEQLQGDPVTTSTDVYAIGVVAYVVLTGQGPYPLRSGRVDETVRAVLTADPLRASLIATGQPQRARRLRGDLDNILARAVAKDPARRYGSVQQLADDIDAHRRGFPVRARADGFAYRLRKFTGRHRIGTAAVVAGLIALVAAIAITVREARVAQRRFDDLRGFARSVVFDVEGSLAPIPGTTAARKQLVETALRYLDRLQDEKVSDVALREEIAAAYLRVGRVQGGAFVANLGDTAGAVASFRKALAAIGPATTANLRRLEIEAHIDIAQLAADPIDTVPEFEAAIRSAETQLKADAGDPETLRLIAAAWHGLATAGHLTARVPAEERASRQEVAYRRRVLDRSPSSSQSELGLAQALASHALALEHETKYADSVAELAAARSILESSLQREPGNQHVVRGLADNRSRAGSVLRAMGRLPESASEIQSAIGLLEPLVSTDPQNVQYRGDLGYAWFRLGETWRAQGELARALAIHRQALVLRRERAARDPSFTFIRWDAVRSLNAVGDLLLALSSANADEAQSMFTDARTMAEETLAIAPSFNELRKQVAAADEGLARAALARSGDNLAEATMLLKRSLQTWQQVLAYGSGDRQDEHQPVRLQRLLASLPAPAR